MTKENRKGFTIIEVVLVLAIAGLIFLMVFIALPALQRSQRNTRRRQDMARILSTITTYQSNNGNKVPCQNSARVGDADCTGANGELVKFINNYVISGDVPATQANRLAPVDSNGSCFEEFCDPDGTSYEMSRFKWGSEGASAYKTEGGKTTFAWESGSGFYTRAQENHEIMLASYAKCDDGAEGVIVKTDGPTNVAIMYVLEGGAVYCGDNQ